MATKTTLKDVAREVGVSVSLVSFVMNDHPDEAGRYRYRVGEQTRRRIKDAAQRLGYRPDAAALSLRGGRSRVVGAVLSDISNPFYGAISLILEELARKQGYTLLIGSTGERKGVMGEILRAFMDHRVDGVVVAPTAGGADLLGELDKAGVPFVVLDRRIEGVAAPRFMLDSVAALGSAVDFLHREKGASKIEMLSYTLRVSSIVDRESGYYAAMERLGCAREARVHQVDFDDIDAQTFSLAPDLLERGVEGLVFATNSLTISAVKALSSLGAAIQKDIFLVGTDNSDVYQVFRPAIPHIEQPIEEMCTLAVSSLFDIILGKAPQKENEVLLPGRLVIPI